MTTLTVEYLDEEINYLVQQREMYLAMHHKADGAVQALSEIRQKLIDQDGQSMTVKEFGDLLDKGKIYENQTPG